MKNRTIGIVAAVIFILAVAAVWSVPHLKARYMRYRCAQNLRDMAKVHTVYMGDHDDEYTVQGSTVSNDFPKNYISMPTNATLVVKDANVCIHDANDPNAANRLMELFCF